MDNKCLIAVGSNMPSQAGGVYLTLTIALRLLQDLDITVRSYSRIYLTPAFPAGSGPDYLNAAVEISTNMSPQEVMKSLHEVEHSLGRTREKRWASRVIDLDLLSYNRKIIPSQKQFLHWFNLPIKQLQETSPQELIIPHPRLHERAFVLIPMLDIAADWRHPVLDQTVKEMVAQLPEEDVKEIVPFGTFDS